MIQGEDMRIGSRLEHFSRAFIEIFSIDDLVDLLQAATRELGYDCFSLAQHVDLSGPLENVVMLSTYDEDWLERFKARGYIHFDPVVTASHRYGGPFTWDMVPMMIPVTKRQHRMFREAKRFGLSDGLTIPLHMPGERLASCSFASARRIHSSIEHMAAAHVVANFAYQAARRLIPNPTPPPRSPLLTDRQIDCVKLSAEGKSEWEISRILSIAQTTVHSHLTDARRRYGVFNRQQLLFHVLRDGLISFSDIQAI